MKVSDEQNCYFIKRFNFDDKLSADTKSIHQDISTGASETWLKIAEDSEGLALFTKGQKKEANVVRLSLTVARDGEEIDGTIMYLNSFSAYGVTWHAFIKYV